MEERGGEGKEREGIGGDHIIKRKSQQNKVSSTSLPPTHPDFSFLGGGGIGAANIATVDFRRSIQKANKMHCEHPESF